ncbi:MAG: sensor histidine kinase [Acutalibacteraceae bacterium]
MKKPGGMIKSLRLKFLATVMFFVTAIIAALVVVIAVVPALRDRKEAEMFLKSAVDIHAEIFDAPSDRPDGFKPVRRIDNGFGGKDNKYSLSNLVTARFNADGELVSWFSDRQDIYGEDYIIETAEKLKAKGREFGTVDGRYYLLSENETGMSLALLDSGPAVENLRRTAALTLLSGAGAWVLLLILAVFLVNRMTEPVSRAMAKQKQFVSDAGHELKTPIAVITANAGVLESEIGENKWLTYIKNEAVKMDGLVKSLMTLAKMEDSPEKAERSEFDLSEAVMSAGLPFESLAFEKGTVVQFEVEPDIKIHGVREQAEQLVGILMSNAVRYGEEKGVIRLSLTKERKKITLSVYNTGQGVPDGEKEKIFERFYRVDKARSREGGNYGLGLAIAKSIAEENGGEIGVCGEYGKWIRFDIVFG